MKKIVICVAAAAAVLVLLVISLVASEEKLIKSNLHTLARTLNKSKGEGIYALLGKVEKLRSLFTVDCKIEVGAPVRDLYGKKSLVAAVTGALRMLQDLQVDFYDITVTVNPDGVSASSSLTVTATAARSGGSQGNLEAREIEMRWRKVKGKWLIATARAVKVFKGRADD